MYAMDKLIEMLISDFQGRELPALTPRHSRLRAMRGKASTVIGMRRSGKTWFCFQQMSGLLAAGTTRDRILYLNFDDERLQPMGQADLWLIPEVYYRLFPDNKKRTCHFFFDEIQNVEGWEPFVRRVLDGEDARLVLTGSSAKLLSRELATSLRGRGLATEIFPFSFPEYVSHLGLEAGGKGFSSAIRAAMESAFSAYLRSGGFPEVIDADEELRRRVLQDYVDVVLFRDVVERHGVSNTTALRHLTRHLLNALAARFSVNKFYHSLRSQGVRCGRDVLHEWLDHLVDAYLGFPVRGHSRSEAVRRVNPPKIYAVDPGLVAAMCHRAEPDRGALLENIVFLALRRKGLVPEYCLTGSGYEVDFLVRTPKGDVRLIQACADLGDEATREREFRAAREAMDEQGLNSATVISAFHEESVETDGRRIEVIPAWRWLLTDPLVADH